MAYPRDNFTTIAVLGLVAIWIYPLVGGALHHTFLVAAAPLAAVFGPLAITRARHDRQPVGVGPLIFFGGLSYGLYLWREAIDPLHSTRWAADRRQIAVASAAMAVISWVLLGRARVASQGAVRAFARIDILRCEVAGRC